MSDASTALAEPPPPVGFVFPETEVEVTLERQRRKLECCGVDPDLWGATADPSFLAFFTIMAQRWTGRSINGNVHMTQVYRLSAPLQLGRPLAMTGEVTRIEPHPRGEIVYADFAFRDTDGATPLKASRSSLNPGEGDADARRPSREPPELSAMQEIGATQLEPERVATFSDEAENLIHSDPATAEKFGFRAPIAGGLMASHIMLGGLTAEAGKGPINGLDAEIAFLRPMFWDDSFRIRGEGLASGPGSIALVRPDGKVACSAVIDG